MDFVALGQKIRKRRLELNYTQEHLAELTGLTPNYVGAIERATSKCSLETLTVIAKVLNLDTDFLLFDIKDQNINYVMSKNLEKLPESKRQLYIELCDSIAKILLA